MYGELFVLINILIIIKLNAFLLVINQGLFLMKKMKENISGHLQEPLINLVDMICYFNSLELSLSFVTKQKILMKKLFQ
mgnify:CR=1 FL=1